ncbi:MAG: RNA polymerase sigma factor [Bacteroidales bacterium]
MERQKKFNEVLAENNSRIRSVCNYYFGNSDDARDAYQEALIKIWLNIQNFRGESLMRTWVTRITLNVCLTHVSKNKRDNSLFRKIGDEEYSVRAEGADDDNEAEEKLKFFREFNSSLSSTDRMLVALYLQDIDYTEISEITGLSSINARTRIHRIKEKIRKEWEVKNGTR